MKINIVDIREEVIKQSERVADMNKWKPHCYSLCVISRVILRVIFLVKLPSFVYFEPKGNLKRMKSIR